MSRKSDLESSAIPLDISRARREYLYNEYPISAKETIDTVYPIDGTAPREAIEMI
jgi:hypothetical protein